MTTAFTELVGVDRPLQQAAMSRVTTPELVAAVANAGALGMAPIGRSGPDVVMPLFDSIETLTDKTFGAGFIVPFLDRDCVDAVAERLDIIEFAFGWPDETIVPTEALVGWLVGTVAEARAAVDAGCAYVMAQGVEAGGHVRDSVPLAELLPAMREAIDVPIVACGGIGTRADADRAFDMGADALRIGTRFLGASESNLHPRYLELLVAATADDTVHCDDFKVGWPGPVVPVRVLASALAAANATEADPVGRLGDRQIPRLGTTPPVRETTGEIEAMALYAGLSVGAMNEVTPAASIIDELLGDR